MELERIFHPIGHGAFYTERITTKDRTINIVYDCGTKNSQKILHSCIDNTFNDDSEIDVLFISHFHVDHISGIGYLRDRCNKKIKTIVLPYMDKISKNIFLLELSKKNISVDLKDELNSLISSPSDYFGSETKLVEVRPELSDEKSQEPIDINSLDQNISVTTGQIIKHFSWIFILANYKYNRFKIT